jgi:hypothetical protein
MKVVRVIRLIKQPSSIYKQQSKRYHASLFWIRVRNSKLEKTAIATWNINCCGGVQVRCTRYCRTSWRGELNMLTAVSDQYRSYRGRACSSYHWLAGKLIAAVNTHWLHNCLTFRFPDGWVTFRSALSLLEDLCDQREEWLASGDQILEIREGSLIGWRSESLSWQLFDRPVWWMAGWKA